MNRIFSRTIASLFILLCAWPYAVFAVSDPSINLLAGSPQSNLSIVTVELSTADKSLNAIEGALSYPKDELSVKEVIDGDSVISFWILQPTVLSAGGEIAFKGLAAGGLSTLHGKLFQVVFMTAPGYTASNSSAKITIKNARGYLNDGHGTPVPLSGGSLELAVPNTIAPTSSTTAQLPENSVVNDVVPPHDLSVSVSQYANVFDNQWFLVFAARDDASGILGYEVQESHSPTPLDGAWVAAQSPYVLHDQSRASYIHVRASDKAKNSSLVTVPPSPQSSQMYTKLLFWCILLVIGIVLGGIVWRKKISRTQLPQQPQ